MHEPISPVGAGIRFYGNVQDVDAGRHYAVGAPSVPDVVDAPSWRALTCELDYGPAI